MPPASGPAAGDPEIATVLHAIKEVCGESGSELPVIFGEVIRRSIDEVLDGPRTGRCELGELTKTEQTYIGTKVEILVRSTLSLEAGVGIDTVIAGTGVDVKWSKKCDWMIGRENVGRICLGLGLKKGGKFCVGLFRARKEFLRKGVNQDKKLSLSARAKKEVIIWLVENATLPSNFLAELDSQTRKTILSGKSAQERLKRLANLVPGTPIPRQAIETVAMTADPLRRTRRDALLGNPLGEMVLLSTKYGRAQLESLGFNNLPKDHWVAVPEADLQKS